MYAARRYFLRDPRVFIWFAFGSAIWLGGALGVELLSNVTDGHRVASMLEILVEELMEMTGVSLMFWGSCLLAQGEGLRVGFDYPPDSMAHRRSVATPSGALKSGYSEKFKFSTQGGA